MEPELGGAGTAPDLVELHSAEGDHEFARAVLQGEPVAHRGTASAWSAGRCVLRCGWPRPPGRRASIGMASTSARGAARTRSACVPCVPSGRPRAGSTPWERLVLTTCHTQAGDT